MNCGITLLQHKAATDIPSLLVFLCVTISPGKKRKEKKKGH